MLKEVAWRCKNPVQEQRVAVASALLRRLTALYCTTGCWQLRPDTSSPHSQAPREHNNSDTNTRWTQDSCSSLLRPLRVAAAPASIAQVSNLLLCTYDCYPSSIPRPKSTAAHAVCCTGAAGNNKSRCSPTRCAAESRQMGAQPEMRCSTSRAPPTRSLSAKGRGASHLLHCCTAEQLSVCSPCPLNSVPLASGHAAQEVLQYRAPSCTMRSAAAPISCMTPLAAVEGNTHLYNLPRLHPHALGPPAPARPAAGEARQTIPWPPPAQSSKCAAIVTQSLPPPPTVRGRSAGSACTDSAPPPWQGERRASQGLPAFSA